MPSRPLSATVVLLAALALPLVAAPQGTESYEGFDLPRLAEATARLTTFRTQHGEKGGNAAFEGWLAGEGLSRSGYDAAYAAWWERFRADPTGQLEARFHRVLAEWSQQLNYGDAKDRRNETREGVSLDAYARVVVALTRSPGAKPDEVMKTHGIPPAKWPKVNEAWTKAMKDDTTYALVQQYGALYQKYAGPQFAAEQEAVLASSLAQRPTPAPTAPRPPAETLEQVSARMKASSGRDRWSAAREYAHACDLWSGPARRDPKDARAAACADAALRSDLAPVLREALDRADDDTIGFAARLASYFGELGLEDRSSELAVRRALDRSKERLETLEASFAPIRDKAVPERVPLRTKIDEYSGAVRDLEKVLAAW